MKAVLTIAGSDSGGGAGIQADLKVFTTLGAFGTSAITAVTAQDTRGVRGVYDISPQVVREQLKTVFDDFDIKALKTGMLFNREIIEEVASEVERQGTGNLVIDPVLVSTSGHLLLRLDAVEVLKDRLMPASLIITPNIPEAETLAGNKIETFDDMEEAAVRLINGGANNVLIKGGHMGGSYASDLLMNQEGKSLWLQEEMLSVGSLHGTGCSLSAAICAFLGRGYDLVEAVRKAKKFTLLAIKNGFYPGKGSRVLDFCSYLKARED